VCSFIPRKGLLRARDAARSAASLEVGEGEEEEEVEEPAPQEVFGREEERVLAETLWSRLKSPIREPEFDL
jgi:hypothetical protein